MRKLVVDGSAVLGLVLPDEGSEKMARALRAAAKLLAPAHWRLEVCNGLLMAERRRRITRSEADDALSFVDGFPVSLEGPGFEFAVNGSLALAREYQLTVYDAAYLELALRAQAELATLDKALARAALRAGVRVLA